MKDHKLEVGEVVWLLLAKNENDRQFLSKGFKGKDFDVQDSSKVQTENEG